MKSRSSERASDAFKDHQATNTVRNLLNEYCRDAVMCLGTQHLIDPTAKCQKSVTLPE